MRFLHSGASGRFPVLGLRNGERELNLPCEWQEEFSFFASTNAGISPGICAARDSARTSKCIGWFGRLFMVQRKTANRPHTHMAFVHTVLQAIPHKRKTLW